MALISAGEWLDRYAADAEGRATEGAVAEQPLTFRIEVETGLRSGGSRLRWRRWRCLTRMPRLHGTFRPFGLLLARAVRRQR